MRIFDDTDTNIILHYDIINLIFFLNFSQFYKLYVFLCTPQKQLIQATNPFITWFSNKNHTKITVKGNKNKLKPNKWWTFGYKKRRLVFNWFNLFRVKTLRQGGVALSHWYKDELTYVPFFTFYIVPGMSLSAILKISDYIIYITIYVVTTYYWPCYATVMC